MFPIFLIVKETTRIINKTKNAPTMVLKSYKRTLSSAEKSIGRQAHNTVKRPEFEIDDQHSKYIM